MKLKRRILKIYYWIKCMKTFPMDIYGFQSLLHWIQLNSLVFNDVHVVLFYFSLQCFLIFSITNKSMIRKQIIKTDFHLVHFTFLSIRFTEDFSFKNFFIDSFSLSLELSLNYSRYFQVFYSFNSFDVFDRKEIIGHIDSWCFLPGVFTLLLVCRSCLLVCRYCLFLRVELN